MTNSIETTAQTPEAVAYELMTDIFRAEGKSIKGGVSAKYATREEILLTYRACLEAAKNPSFGLINIENSRKAA